MLNSLLVKSIIKKDIESGEISGTTEKASKDSEGNVITETYATKKESENSDELLSKAIKEEETRSNEYTDQKIADLINGAPTTLDTLKEIADAMDDKLESEVATDFSEAETPKFQQTINDVLDGVNELKSDLVHKSHDKVFGKIDVSNNIVNPKYLSQGYITSDGSIALGDDNLRLISDYIPVNGNNISGINIYSGKFGSINVYDENYNYLRTIINSKSYTYVDGDFYVKIAYYNVEIPMANYGDVAMPITAYKEKSIKELLDESNRNEKYLMIATTNIVNPNRISTGLYINANGEISNTNETEYKLTDYIPVNGNNISSVNAFISTKFGRYAVYDENYNYIRHIVGNKKYTYVDGDYYVRISYYASSDDFTCMANYGDKEISVTPYKEKLVFNSSVITVGDSQCDFTSIQDAVDNANDTPTHHVTILVSDGTYERFNLWNETAPRNVSIIGSNRDSVIVLDESGDYAKSCLNIRNNGTISNITFIQNTNAEEYSQRTSDVNYAYAVHIDHGNCKLTFDNCVFKSNAGPSVGIGMQENKSLVFNNCLFESTADGTFGLNTLGAFYLHTAVRDNALNQHIEITNCQAVNKYGEHGYRLGIITQWQGHDVVLGTYDALIRNSSSYGVNGASAFIGSGLLNNYSFNNNCFNLNGN